MSKQIGNLFDALFAATDLKPDSRFTHWAKFITGVNESKNDGYAFEGAFVGKGTIDYEVKPQAFLLASVEGSRKNNATYYRVVVMDADGNLAQTDIKTNSETPGWALRIRTQVAALLASLSSEPMAAEKASRIPVELYVEDKNAVEAIEVHPTLDKQPDLSEVTFLRRASDREVAQFFEQLAALLRGREDARTLKLYAHIKREQRGDWGCTPAFIATEAHTASRAAARPGMKPVPGWYGEVNPALQFGWELAVNQWF